MNQYYLAMFLGLGAVLGFFILWFIFGRFTKNPYIELEEAQKASVEHHYLATGLNAVGLGLGIFLVFFMASWGEMFITLGMIFVLLSIVAYVGFEWVAKYDDKEIARLQEIIRIKEVARQDAGIALQDAEIVRHDDEIGQLKEIIRIEEMARQEALARSSYGKDGPASGGAFDSKPPNTLRLKNGYIEMTYEPRETKDASQ